jgi:hypothetical protein
LFDFYAVNIGDQIDYSKKVPLADLGHETLSLMELHGGPAGYRQIRLSMPTYEQQWEPPLPEEVM